VFRKFVEDGTQMPSPAPPEASKPSKAH